MTKINSNASFLIDEYIKNLAPFSKEICSTIRELIHLNNNAIIEDWKWKTPIFHTSKMICGFGAFKKHVSLIFFNGAEMSDEHQLFSSDCSAQKTRTIKFESIIEINKNQLLDYFKEAFLLTQIPRKKPKNKVEFEIPELLQAALDKNMLAKKNFENMTYTYRKEYALHISDAKREITKINRLEKVILNLEKNIKMHEHYKCS